MIVGELKNLGEIWNMIKDYSKVLVFACNTCVAICHAGGNKEAEILASLLRIKAKQEGKDLELTTAGIERQCEHEFFDSAAAQIDAAEAILSLACGAGVQFLGEKWPAKIVLPGLNTTFIGVVDAPGIFTENCQMCGDCILHLTAGICPVSRCSKSILNGPCGGSENGVCEVSKDIPCGWQLIYDRLKAQGRLHLLDTIIPAKSWLTARDGGPRKYVRPDIMKEKETANGSAE